MNRALPVLALLASALVLGQQAAPKFLTVDAVMRDTKKHHEKPVLVRGKVKEFRERTSQRGTKYTTFKLEGERASLNVFVREHLTRKPKNGDVVEVNGIFRETKTVGSRTFKNEIDATRVTGRRFGVKIVSTVSGRPPR